ncbi:unnamed protein product [Linum trigynum]|uniref:Uncharacterized protein n=1 Tax=Linum trigynum TaxID=586398 RepID=A0AAV2FNP9_9ROSI
MHILSLPTETNPSMVNGRKWSVAVVIKEGVSSGQKTKAKGQDGENQMPSSSKVHLQKESGEAATETRTEEWRNPNRWNHHRSEQPAKAQPQE